ncbi:hypothetical protein BC940DRAFT_305975 [Gongronella butleri]|nr:hypothetical protein BC940DRAFT_305975 [Gongronella butleri]
MMRAIEHNRAKIDQLSQSIRHAASNPSFRSMTPPMDAPGDHDDDDDQEDYDDNAYPLLFAPMYWQDELSWDDDQGNGHPDSEDDDASIIMDNGQGGMVNGGVIMMPASSRYQHHYEPHIPGPRRASVSPRLYAAAAPRHMHPSAPPPLHLQARHYAAPSPPTPRSRASSSSYVNRAPPQPFVPPMVFRRSMPPPKTHYSCPSVYDSEFY